MNWFAELTLNPFLITSLSSWAIAQVLKVFIHAAVHKKFDLLRLFGDGGMPSGHSATVTSLATIAALVYGPGSFEFAFSGILAIIVCHDAAGVRLETGKQAILINEMKKIFETLSSEALPEVKLKEFVGHTPTQVAAGTLIGILNGIGMFFLLY